MKYILALDQGTTSSRSIVFNRRGEAVSVSQKEFRQIYPRPGWVEHDPNELLDTQTKTAIASLKKAGLSATDIQAAGITNQRETTIIWDRDSGEPIHNAIVWQDRRTSEFCDQIRAKHADLIRRTTGLEVDAYFSASKVWWLLENVPGARIKAEKGELAFGTVDTWLIWKLTSGKAHFTDVSNASRTMLFNIHSLEWDRDLLNIFGIPYMLLPSVKASSEIYRRIEHGTELDGIEIAGVAGDQQAALFGHGCFDAGAAKCTYGTGCFLLQNTGQVPSGSSNRLITTVGWQMNDAVNYALEGSVFIGGAVIQWLRDALGVIDTSQEVNEIIDAVPDSAGVVFVPAFTGLGAPYWDQDARGMIIGLTRGTGIEHIARAALDSIAFQTADLLTAMNADSGVKLNELRVDGGATRNDLLLQFQADLLQIPVVRSKVREVTALGAAYLAGLSSGYWRSTEELSDRWEADRTFRPNMKNAKAAMLLQRWHEAVERALRWEKK